MFEIKDKHTRQAIEDAIKNPEDAEFPPFWELNVAGELISGQMETLTRETGDNGGMVLDTTIAQRIDLSLTNAPCHVHLYVGGEKIPFFAGRLGKPKVSTSSTEIIGQSGATYLDKVKLQKDLNFIGNPAKLIKQVVQHSQAYGHGQIRIKHLRGHLQRTNTTSSMSGAPAPAWTADQSVRDVISAVQNEIKCVMRDTPKGHMGSFECFMDPMERELKNPVWDYEAEHEEGFSHAPSDDEMPFDVVVQRPDAQDTSQPAQSPPTGSGSTTAAPSTASTTKIIPGFIVRVPVKYKHISYSPLKRYTDWTVLSDTSGATPTSYGEAKKQAKETAAKFARQYQDFTITVAMNPLLEMYDIISIAEDVYEKDGRRRFEWIGMVKKLKDDGATMTTEISGAAHLKKQTFTENPPIRLSGRTPGVLETPIPLERVFGIDALGLWVNTDFTTNSSGVPWAGIDEGGLWVDVDLSEGRAGHDEDGKLFFDIPENI